MSIRQLMIDVMDECGLGTSNQKLVSRALLEADELAAIIDIAAWWAEVGDLYAEPPFDLSPAVQALLADWRANR